MDLRGIFEGKEDLRYQEEASALAGEIGRWIIQHNEDTPIESLFHRRRIRDTIGYIMNVRSMGVEGDYDDLNFGFIEGGTAEAFMAMGTDERRKAYFVFVRVPDAGSKTDIMYSVKWSHLIHELTHYIDRKRSETKPSKAPETKEIYYNSPMEFNAYFHQGLYDVMLHNHRNVPDNFPEFLRQNQVSFDYSWREHMTPDTKRKFIRRLYGVWNSLMDRQGASLMAA